MFAGFNLVVDDSEAFSDFYTEGLNIYKSQITEVKKTLESYMLDENIIDASRIEDAWFPNVEADVFISHSRFDKFLAIGLAGWLNCRFGIKPFVDSCVWNHADSLLKLLDDRYCVSCRKDDGSTTYSYKKRNLSTSHVHIILNTALQKMIDNTECLLFLNTPHSLPTNQIINGNATASPWIYSELMFSRMVKRKKRKELYHSGIFAESNIDIRYKALLSHLADIGSDDLLDLQDEIGEGDCYGALDYLYRIGNEKLQKIYLE